MVQVKDPDKGNTNTPTLSLTLMQVKDPDKGNTPTIMKAMEMEHTSADLPDTHK